MAFFKVNISEESIRDNSGSNFMTKSGIYPVVVRAVCVDVSPNGSEYLNLVIDYNGQLQTIYRAITLTNNDGSQNFGARLFTKFCVICGIANGRAIKDPVMKMLPIGRNGENIECSVLPDFVDVHVHLRIQIEYNKYNGEIRSNKKVMNFFRYVDKATASEIVNNENFGEQFAKESEYADRVSYRNTDEMEVKEWLSNRNNKKETPKLANGFGVQRRFGRSAKQEPINDDTPF